MPRGFDNGQRRETGRDRDPQGEARDRDPVRLVGSARQAAGASGPEGPLGPEHDTALDELRDRELAPVVAGDLLGVVLREGTEAHAEGIPERLARLAPALLRFGNVHQGGASHGLLLTVQEVQASCHWDPHEGTSREAGPYRTGEERLSVRVGGAGAL